MRRPVFRYALLPLLFVVVPAKAGSTSAHPNIILIEADDQRPDAGGCLGDASYFTPSIDALAASGTMLTDVRNQGSYNAAVCVASRAMVMSGRSLWHYDDNLKGAVTLGQLLRKNGYVTLGTGKWHNGEAALLRSFDVAENITPGFLPKGHDSVFALTDIRNGKATHGKNTDRLHSTYLIGETALKLLDGYKDAKPFFLYVGFNAPHDPYTHIPEQEKRYRHADGTPDLPTPPAFAPEPEFDIGTLRIRDEVLLPRPLDPAALAAQNVVYHAMISHLDGYVGRIVATLKAKGLDRNTIVIFTSDHGLARGSNGLLGKQNLYEHTLRIPFVVAGPGVPAGRRDASPVYNYELYRTVADFAGATPPAEAEGTSFRKILEGGSGDRKTVYHGYTSLMRAVAEDGWKLVEYRVGKNRRTQLFDLKNDPLEIKNLAADPAQKDRIASLRKTMVAQRDFYGDRDAAFWNGLGFGTPVVPGKRGPHTAREEE